MAYRLAVCDDDPAVASDMKNIIQRWASDAGHAAAVETFPSAEAFLFRYAEEKRFDIMLLDIEMGRINGVALAREIRAGNGEIQIVFVTGYSDYIADGYEVEALHYLVKPVGEGKLRAVLDRAAERLKKNERVLAVSCAEGALRIPLREIAFIEVRQNYVTIHAGGEYTVKMTLGEAEKQLDERFFRTGRSHIVNLNHIRKISKTDAHLRDGQTVPLPRGAYEALNRALIRYL